SRSNSPTQNDGPQTVLRSFGFRTSHRGSGNIAALFARLLQSPAAGNAFVGVIDQQKRSRFGKLAAQISRDERLKVGAPFNAIDFRSGAVRAHLRRTDFRRDALPNAICALTYQVIANLLRANSVSNFVQNVVEFVVLHDLTPMIALTRLCA